MFLFIFESIGTSELLLVGVVALIFLGPRRLPDLAKKAGKIMAEFRGTANEFKQTWEREVDFEEEKRALSLGSLDEDNSPVARDAPASAETTTVIQDQPVIRAADPDAFRHLRDANGAAETEAARTETPSATHDDANDKQNWL